VQVMNDQTVYDPNLFGRSPTLMAYYKGCCAHTAFQINGGATPAMLAILPCHHRQTLTMTRRRSRKLLKASFGDSGA
jgi:hypothetical protein